MSLQTVTIIGVGLIGGSFGLALRAAGFRGRILGVSSARALESGLRSGALDEAASLPEAVAAADLVYLAQPIGRILSLLPEVRQHARPGCLVTDAGSTKLAIVEQAAALFTDGPWFLGGHPMAGKAQRGVELAEAGLFSGATYVLTPHEGRLPEIPAAAEFLEWIRRMGAVPLILSAREHDEVVTWTSHLPQVVSSALALAVSRHVENDQKIKVAGSGLRDMTRLAESPYDIWKDVFATNQDNIEHALDRFIACLKHFQEHLTSGELGSDFEAARRLREKLSGSPL
jgi:prephenate dehydrogenase